MNEYKFNIGGLDCPNCSAKFERAIAGSKLFSDVSLSFVNKTLVLYSEEDYECVVIEINKIINKVEPDAFIVDEHEHHHHHHHEHHHEHCECGHHHDHHHDHHHEHCECNHHKHHEENNKINIIMMVLSIVLLVIGLIIDNFTSLDLLSIVLFITSYLVISYDILIKSFKNIIRGQVFDENFLMAIASIGALFLKEFHEAILVIFLYKLGEMFQDYALNNSHKSIKNLLELQPSVCHLVRGNDIKDVEPKDVKVDDIILVKAGERVPLDGEIYEGESSFDTSSINGESLPKDLKELDYVNSGYINLSKVIKVKVKKIYEDSLVSKMLKMIEESSINKSNNEKFITKFSKYYTPIVCLLAFLLVSIPSLIHVIDPLVINDGFSSWLYRGLVFLVVSCPCALVISVPLAFFSGIGRCSKDGILVKGSNYLEKMSKVDTIVFDKTGTITKGNFKVNEVINKNTSKEEVLKYAYICDYYSNHPIALAIKDNVKDANFIGSNYEELSGLGSKCLFNDKVILVGNYKLMELNNINYIKEDLVGTLVYVSYDNVYLGCIVIKDELKENIVDSIKLINDQNINTLMLSGDNESIVKEVCESVGIKEYKSNLNPLDKVNELDKLLVNKKNNIVYIGDGINDAPSLVKADVGISMGNIGSDVSIESSDIVINDDNIDKINTLIKVSKKTSLIVKENIAFSILVKSIVMILSTFGFANIILGILADVGVMILAVLNSIRILYIKK